MLKSQHRNCNDSKPQQSCTIWNRRAPTISQPNPHQICWKVAQRPQRFESLQLQILREAKPGGFQTGGFPTFIGKGPDCVADPFGTVPRRWWAEKDKRDESGKSPDHPRANRENPGKNRESPKKDKKGQKRKDKSRSGNPPVWNPPV